MVFLVILAGCKIAFYSEGNRKILVYKDRKTPKLKGKWMVKDGEKIHTGYKRKT